MSNPTYEESFPLVSYVDGPRRGHALVSPTRRPPARAAQAPPGRAGAADARGRRTSVRRPRLSRSLHGRDRPRRGDLKAHDLQLLRVEGGAVLRVHRAGRPAAAQPDG